MCRVRHLSSSRSSHTVLSTEYSDTSYFSLLCQMLPIDFLECSHVCYLSLAIMFLNILTPYKTHQHPIYIFPTGQVGYNWPAEKVLCCHPGPKSSSIWSLESPEQSIYQGAKQILQVISDHVTVFTSFQITRPTVSLIVCTDLLASI